MYVFVIRLCLLSRYTKTLVGFALCTFLGSEAPSEDHFYRSKKSPFWGLTFISHYFESLSLFSYLLRNGDGNLYSKILN